MKIQLRDKFKIYSNIKEFNLSEGLTILAGCNGAGKSTLISEIVAHFKENHIPFKHLDCNRSFHFRDANDIGKDYEMGIAIQKGFVSEHEHYENMFSCWVTKIRPTDDITEMGLFIDGLDSGGDVVNYERHIALFKLICNDCKKRNIKLYLVVTCNNFSYLSAKLKGEALFLPTFDKRKLPVYDSTEFLEYIKDIKITTKVKESR